jgi:hypothetical protein
MTWKELLRERFGVLIGTKSVETGDDGTFSPTNDNRERLKREFTALISEEGLGVAMVVLHMQQVRTRHLLSTLTTPDGQAVNLSVATTIRRASNGMHFLNVPFRRYRGDRDLLESLGVFNPHLDKAKCAEFKHADGKECFYCSAEERLLQEILVPYGPFPGPDCGSSGSGAPAGQRPQELGSYTLGFTFAPFGRPDDVIHFLAWDRPTEEGVEPLNMDLQPSTTRDLLALVRELNRGIEAYFAEAGIAVFPRLDGIFNGWAGSTIYHQHYQFFKPENAMPVRGSGVEKSWRRSGSTICRRRWPLPVYSVSSECPERAADMAQGLARDWVAMDKGVRHSQNLYVPGDTGGIAGCARGEHVVFLWPRTRTADYENRTGVSVDGKTSPIPGKKGLASLEAAGAFIIDDPEAWAYIESCTSEQRAELAETWHRAVSPEEERVREWEQAAGVLT